MLLRELVGLSRPSPGSLQGAETGNSTGTCRRHQMLFWAKRQASDAPLGSPDQEEKLLPGGRRASCSGQRAACCASAWAARSAALPKPVKKPLSGSHLVSGFVVSPAIPAVESQAALGNKVKVSKDSARESPGARGEGTRDEGSWRAGALTLREVCELPSQSLSPSQ